MFVAYLEDDLLAIAERFDIVEFPGGNLALLVRTVRRPPRRGLDQHGRAARGACSAFVARRPLLVTIGACATAGGIQAFGTGPTMDRGQPPSIRTRSLWIYWLWRRRRRPRGRGRRAAGCPIDPRQLLELLTALVVGRRPQLPDELVCAECKRRGATCVVVAAGVACLGPVTRTGCGALCPAYGRAATAASARAETPT